jgi:signal transduction histidine kinase
MSEPLNAALREQNLPGLKTAALASMLFSATALMSDSTSAVIVGLGVAGLGGITLLLLRGLPKLLSEHVDLIGFVLVVSMGSAFCALQTMDQLSGGVLVLSLVILFVWTPQIFNWRSPRLALTYTTLTLIGAVFGDLEPVAVGGLIAAAMVGFLGARTRLQLTFQNIKLADALQGAANTERASLGELKDMDRLKTGFYSSIVEGLRGPLTLMLSPLDSMLSGDVGNFQANQIEYLETVRRNALRVLRLSDDLVDLTHLESGLLRIQTEQANLVGMLQGVVDHATVAAQTKGVQIGFSTDTDEVILNSDIEELERAVTHLVSTAIRYTSHGGRVDISLAPNPEGAEIVIRDNGAGLPPDWIEAIASTEQSGKWLPPRSPEGLGLVLAREIVHLHSGEFTTISRPEVGTTFTITLPAIEAPGTSSRPGENARATRLRESDDYRYGNIIDSGQPDTVAHEPSESKATKVLVVDDNPEILQFTKGLLAKEHAVFVAANGEDGLALAQTELPDVVITDTRMPKLDGAGLIKAMQEDPRLAQVPTIILTARNQVADREAARESGADLVMDKPFNPRELRTAIQELFAKQHRQASNFMNEQARSFEIISAGLAHEMHNPLAYIKNANFVIGESARKIMTAAQDPELSQEERDRRFNKAKDKIDKMLPVSDRGIKKVEQLVALMRRYAREGYSSDAIEMQIDQNIADVLAMIAPKDNKEVNIEPDLAAPDAIIKGVPEELQQAITNLTQNAVDAVGKGGHVWVRTRPEARSVRIEVADDGPGIPREALARIFTPFFTTKEVGKGMGLGLTITRQVIKQHGGTLEVDSTPGQGTTFTIRLPLASELVDDLKTQSALELAAAADVTPDEPTDTGDTSNIEENGEAPI